MKIIRKTWSWLSLVFWLLVAVTLTESCKAQPFTPIIDTRQGGAQVNEAVIFPTIYSVTNDGGYYGDVEFRGGITTDYSSPTPIIELGTASTLNGSVYVPSDGGITPLLINLRFNLTLGHVLFQTDTDMGNPAVIGFQWGTSGDTNPYTILFTSDVTVGSGVTLLLWSLTPTVTGNLNGNNHTLILESGSQFSPISLTSEDLVVENLTIQGAENVQSIYVDESSVVHQGTNIFQNVSMYTSITDNANMLNMPLTSLIYRGLNNVLGGGGIINFIKSGTGLGTRIASQTELTVNPQTQLLLGHASVPGGSFITFDDATALLYLNNCFVEIGGCSGDYVTWQKGTVYINGIVTLRAHTGGSYLQLGDGVSSANDCNLVILPGSQLFIDNGATLVNKNLGSTSITFMDSLTSGFTVNTTGILNNLGVLKVSGVLNAGSTANITGNNVIFNNGIYTNGIFNVIFSGLYSPSLANPIYLNGSATFNAVRQGSIPANVTVNGTGNVMEGSPSFANTNAVQLNSGAALTLALQSELNQNIVLNGNTLTLGADLSLGDSVLFSGPCTVNLNGYNLIFGQQPLTWANPLTLSTTIGSASNLVMNANLQLTNQWSFAANSTVHIVGNNEILDITSGTISIGAGAAVTLSNLTLNGLGTGHISIASGATLYLQNVTIILNQSVTISQGNVTVTGPSTIVVGNYFLTFNGSSVLTVGTASPAIGAVLTYDTLTYNDQNNIVFAAPANESLLSGSSIRKLSSLKLGNFIYTGGNPILDSLFVVSPLRTLNITNNTTINGDGFGFQFARYPSSPIVTVSPGVSAQFTNMLLQDFPIYNNSFGVGSQVIFGDQTTVELGTSGTLTTTWMFSGNVVLSGVGNTLQLGTTAQLILRPKTSLLIDNLTISGIQRNNIWCMDNSSTVSFGNVTWVQSNTFTLTQSHFEVLGTLDVQGTSTFAYASNRASIITNFGNLLIDSGMTFSYEPPIANRCLLVMQTANSLLTLNSATLASTTTGLQLTTGTIDVNGACYTVNDNAVALSQGISLGNGTPANDVTVNFGAGSTLNAESGLLVYQDQD